jgi:hypothetical protein
MTPSPLETRSRRDRRSHHRASGANSGSAPPANEQYFHQQSAQKADFTHWCLKIRNMQKF